MVAMEMPLENAQIQQVRLRRYTDLLFALNWFVLIFPLG